MMSRPGLLLLPVFPFAALRMRRLLHKIHYTCLNSAFVDSLVSLQVLYPALVFFFPLPTVMTFVLCPAPHHQVSALILMLWADKEMIYVKWRSLCTNSFNFPPIPSLILPPAIAQIQISPASAGPHLVKKTHTLSCYKISPVSSGLPSIIPFSPESLTLSCGPSEKTKLTVPS